jgi:hypothetical protein
MNRTEVPATPETSHAPRPHIRSRPSVSTYAPELMFIDLTFPDVARIADASIIEILFLEGRTVEQKKKLFRRIVDRAVSAGFSADDVMIALTENAPVDWSLARGLAFGGHDAPMMSR